MHKPLTIRVLKPLSILLMFGLTLPNSTFSANLTLTLAQVFDQIEKENLETVIQKESVKQAFESIRLERSRYMPQLEFHASWNCRKNFSELQASSGIDAGEANIVRRNDAKIMGIIPLVDLGKWYDIRAMQKRYSMSVLEEKWLFQETLKLAATQFLEVIRSNRESVAIDGIIARDLELVNLASQQVKSGLSTRIDLLRAKSILANDQNGQMAHDTQESIYMLSLKRLLNIELSKDLNIVSVEFSVLQENSNVSEVIAKALEKRADLKYAAEELEKNQVVKRAQSAKRYPTLTFYGEYGVDHIIRNQSSAERWKALLLVTVPIFDGFNIRSRERIAKSKVEASKYRLNLLSQRLKVQILQTRKKLDNLSKQSQLMGEHIEFLREEFKLAKMRFVEGLADNQEAIEALRRLAEKEFELIRLGHEYGLARLEYAYYCGDVRDLLTD